MRYGSGGPVKDSDAVPRTGAGKVPELEYTRGPTQRLQPRSTRPSSVSPSAPREAGPRSSSGGPDRKGRKSVQGWRDLRRTDPEKSREILTTNRTLGRVRDAVVGTTIGGAGGVYPSPNRGSHPVNEPWGFDCDDDGWSFGFSFSFGYGWPCSYWWWPCYWSWYYPYWYSCYAPYSYPVYAYYPYYPYYYPSTTVVYPAETTQVVYAQEEPVGEAAVTYRAETESALSIAAQRYLELGDRAFREGRYTDAVQFYAKAVEFAPDQGALYLVLADALFAAGDYHYGAYAIRRALELDPALVETTVDKHSFYPDPAVFDQHLVVLERYLGEHPSDRDARLVLGLNYLFGARPADAVRTLEAGAAAMDDAAAQRILQRARGLTQ